MELIDIESMRSRLDEEFLGLEPMLTGMRLVPVKTSAKSLVACQESLKVTFPSSFTDIVTRFDFGLFTIGPVAFCNTGNYFEWLTKINNTSHDPSWSGNSTRPAGVILIANSDRFSLFLNTVSGHVLSLEHGGNVPADMFKIADNFELFLRGLGTAFLNRHPEGDNVKLGQQIALQVNGSPENRFWQWIVA